MSNVSSKLQNMVLSIFTHHSLFCKHYSDFIIGAMASQITSLTIVYSTVYSGADQRESQSSASLALCVCEGGDSPVTGEFPAQMSSNAEDVSIWWRHHESQELRNCQFVLHVLLLAPTPDIPLWIGNAILHTNKSCSTYVLVHRPDCVVKHISRSFEMINLIW